MEGYKMMEKMFKNYETLNGLAETNGIVIFGGATANDIPLCELKQAFALEGNLYNRSVPALSVENAVSIYDRCVSPLNPETLLLHVGEADLDDFAKDPAGFDQKYRELIAHIRTLNSRCDITVISLRNHPEAEPIAEMNRHLKYIAEAEHCHFEDIASGRLWNPKGTKDVVSFVYSLGFVHPLKNKRPLYDLVKILFCYQATPEV